MARIKALVPITGIHASLPFVEGVSETDNPWLIEWFQAHGYEVTEPPPEDELFALTVKELTAHAESLGVELGKATKKADIIALIRAAEIE